MEHMHLFPKNNVDDVEEEPVIVVNFNEQMVKTVIFCFDKVTAKILAEGDICPDCFLHFHEQWKQMKSIIEALKMQQIQEEAKRAVKQ